MNTGTLAVARGARTPQALRPAGGEVPAESLQKYLEHSPGRLRCPCRLKRANVRHRGCGGPRRWGQRGEACSATPCPDPQVPPGLEYGCLGLRLKRTRFPEGMDAWGSPVLDLSPQPSRAHPRPTSTQARSQHPGPMPATALPDVTGSTAASPGGAGGAARPLGPGKVPP